MKGVKQGNLLAGILICAAIVAVPMIINSFSRIAVLNRAVKSGAVGQVRAMLDARPELVNGTEKRTGATPLHWAVIADHPNIARLLIERGADVDAPDKHGLTPLHKTASFNRPAMADLLISNGADMDARGMKYRAFLMNPLHLAAEAGFPDVVETLLAAGADVNARTEGMNSVSPLHMAASRGHFTVARLLLDNGADVNARDSNEATPLTWARKSGQHELDELLRVFGGRE